MKNNRYKNFGQPISMMKFLLDIECSTTCGKFLMALVQQKKRIALCPIYYIFGC